MVKNNLDAVLVSSVPSIIYLTGYSGFFTTEREGFLLICKDKQYFLTDARSSGEVKEQVKDFTLAQISTRSPFRVVLGKLIKKHHIERLGIEDKNLTIQENKILFSHYNNTYHYSDIINSLRIVKEKTEVELIENACKLGDKTFEYILKEIRIGITEKEVASKIEVFIKQNLADISFPPIVAFGRNSAIPHHQVTDNKLTNNQIVLLDFGVKLNNYCSDMTRTVFFGKAPKEFRKTYHTVLEAQKFAIENLGRLTSDGGTERSRSNSSEADSIKAKNVDKTARDYIISQGYKTIPHSLGHGIGLEVHEAPRLSPSSKDILKENTVFSVEPGIYVPNFGGVRIEDLVVLEKNKLRILTHSPKALIEL